MTDAPSNIAKPKTRRLLFSFSLRTLLIVVTLAGCGFGWLGLKIQEARRQQAAVASIEKVGGFVEYDYEVDSQGIHLPNALPTGPARLRALLGDDFFRTVYRVSYGRIGSEGMYYFTRAKFNDAGIERLEGLTHLTELCFSSTPVTDAGLRHLQGLKQLKSLWLGKTQVTDTGLGYLSTMAELEVLDLSGTQLTDAGLEHLTGLSHLKVLLLDTDWVTDAGAEHLLGLARLKKLSLRNTHVTDEGMAKLQRALPNCLISR